MRGCVFALLLAVGAAQAHDSWLTPLPATPRGELALALGTGDRFPAYDTTLEFEHLTAAGCRVGNLRETPLRRLGEQPQALLLRTARSVPGAAAASCWVQLVPYDIVVPDALVEVYLKEVNASTALRQRWADIRARGGRWNERYQKHARIEIDGDGAPQQTAPVDGLGLDARLLAPRRPVRVGDTVAFQLLRDGQPLAGQPVELRNDLSPVGIWRSTDAAGRLEIALPLAARWLLRAVDLRPSTRAPDAWDSRFITLAFEVKPAP